jgi:cystathionine beta-synthase
VVCSACGCTVSQLPVIDGGADRPDRRVGLLMSVHGEPENFHQPVFTAMVATRPSRRAPRQDLLVFNNDCGGDRARALQA